MNCTSIHSTYTHTRSQHANANSRNTNSDSKKEEQKPENILKQKIHLIEIMRYKNVTVSSAYNINQPSAKLAVYLCAYCLVVPSKFVSFRFEHENVAAI